MKCKTCTDRFVCAGFLLAGIRRRGGTGSAQGLLHQTVSVAVQIENTPSPEAESGFRVAFRV